jgi:hypothetical protein
MEMLDDSYRALIVAGRGDRLLLTESSFSGESVT